MNNDLLLLLLLALLVWLSGDLISSLNKLFFLSCVILSILGDVNKILLVVSGVFVTLLLLSGDVALVACDMGDVVERRTLRFIFELPGALSIPLHNYKN